MKILNRPCQDDGDIEAEHEGDGDEVCEGLTVDHDILKYSLKYI